MRYPTRKSQPASNTARMAVAAPKWTWMAPDHPQPAQGRPRPTAGGPEQRCPAQGDCRCPWADGFGRPQMALGGFRWPPAIGSFSNYGEIRCSEFRRSRQLWGVFVVSSNNDANVPLKQMTKFLGNSTYKVSLKKILGGWQNFCLMKIGIYSFM